MKTACVPGLRVAVVSLHGIDVVFERGEDVSERGEKVGDLECGLRERQVLVTRAAQPHLVVLVHGLGERGKLLRRQLAAVPEARLNELASRQAATIEGFQELLRGSLTASNHVTEINQQGERRN